jgi:cell division protein FtsN
VSIHYNKQSQFELFPDALGAHADTKKLGFFRTTLIISLDNLVVLGIVLLMSLVVAFSLGVERGKYVVRLREQKSQLKTLSMLVVPPPVTTTPSAATTPSAVPSSPRSRMVVQPPAGQLLPTSRSNVIPTANSPRTISAPGAVPGRRPVNIPLPVVAPQPTRVQRPVVNQRPEMVRASLSLPVPVARNNGSRTPIAPSPSSITMPQPVLAANRSVPLPIADSGVQKKVDNSYTVQVASYANAGEAQRVAADLRKRGQDAFVRPKGKFAILCVGKFSSKPDAESASKKFNRQYPGCLVRSL